MKTFLFVLVLFGFTVSVPGQERQVFEAEDCSLPQDAWGKNIRPGKKWNLWSTDKDADKKWSGGVVLQSAPVLKDRVRPEEGAPMLHTIIKDVPLRKWNVRLKFGRALAVSLDQKNWINLQTTGGQVGTFDTRKGPIEFWVDDRFALRSSPGSTYYDCVYLEPALTEKTGVVNGDFEDTKSLSTSGWSWGSRDRAGSARLGRPGKSGQQCARLFYDQRRDWALTNRGRLSVKPGEVWTASAWMKTEKTEGIDLAIVGLSKGRVLRWNLGFEGIYGTQDWTKVEATAEIPPECDQVYVRFVGSGRLEAWVDEISFRRGQAELRVRTPKPKVNGWAKTRVEEPLGRGMLALPVGGGKIYLGWRFLRQDRAETAFNLYRSVNGGPSEKVNSEPIVRTTNFVDEKAVPGQKAAYWVRTLMNGKEGEPSEKASVAANQPVRPYLSFKLAGSTTFQKVGIGDLDGDGRYDFVIKQPNSNIDPYRFFWHPSPGPYTLEAYRSDGTFLWKKSLGWAIEQGIWYSPFLVYDFNGDGRAEVAVKTGQGDHREKDGRVREGQEFLAIWDGMTGREIAKAFWPSRDGFGGSAAYNYASRNQIGIAYLDGKTPCILAARGTYTVMKLGAWQLYQGRLEPLWKWDSREEGSRYRSQGAHFMHTADVDEDAREEVILGSCVIDDNGQGLWSTGMGHCDHCYVGDIDPARPGLEIYYGMETRQFRNGTCLVDARTGRILWGIPERTYHVHSSGLCSDFDPLNPGMECYSGEKEMPKDRPKRWLHSAKGELLENELTWNVGLAPRAVYWDADPQRELLLRHEIRDYRGKTHTRSIEGSHSFWADILGDWREEIVTSVAGELRIYTTAIPAEDRRPTLMQDPIYRHDVAHLAMGYPQPPMTSTCLSSHSAALGIRLGAPSIRPGRKISGTVILSAPAEKELSGKVNLEIDRRLEARPASFDLTAPAAGRGKAAFEIRLVEALPLLERVRDLHLTARLAGPAATLQAAASIKVEDMPLTNVPKTQAEAFCGQAGGNVHLRDDKVAAEGKCFSHWDDEGHWLEWELKVPSAGQYRIVLRYCSPDPVQREWQLDGASPVKQEFSATGGFAAGSNDWAHAALAGKKGQFAVFNLAAGVHRLRMTNTDGKGMNLDTLALIKCSGPSK